jgi:AcrR family transcriptional regulator
MPQPDRHSPRKAPRQGRAVATVDAIIEAAARIIEADGLDALTTNRIAEKAGVGIGSLYQYFPAREAILAALIARENASFAATMLATLEATQETPLPETQRSLITTATTHQLSRVTLSRTLDLVEVTLPPAPNAQADLTQQLTARLAPANIPNPAEAARDCFAITRGMIDAAGMLREADHAHLAARITRAVLGYLGLQHQS